MISEVLHHIERLRIELATVDPRGEGAAIVRAVDDIAAGLRDGATSASHGSNGAHEATT